MDLLTKLHQIKATVCSRSFSIDLCMQITHGTVAIILKCVCSQA